MSCMFNFSEDCLSTYKVNDMFNRLFVNINARNPACLSLLLKHIYKNYSTPYIRSAYIYICILASILPSHSFYTNTTLCNITADYMVLDLIKNDTQQPNSSKLRNLSFLSVQL